MSNAQQKKLITVDFRRSEKTIKVLEMLMQRAKEGTLNGLVFTAWGPAHKHPVSGWTGNAASDPLAALGMLDILYDDLRVFAQQSLFDD